MSAGVLTVDVKDPAGEVLRLFTSRRSVHPSSGKRIVINAGQDQHLHQTLIKALDAARRAEQRGYETSSPRR